MSATGWFLVALIFALATVLALLYTRRATHGGDTVSEEARTVGPDDGARAEIHREVAAGRKIQAIKIYRERTGAGLRVAKEAVEAMERGEPLPPSSTIADIARSGPVRWDDLVPRLTALKAEGQSIAAIKLLRERTSMSLLDAKNAVDRL